jgi:hypothetical protein
MKYVINLKIPVDLSRYSDGATSFQMDGSNVGEVFDELFIQLPDLKKRIVSDAGQLFPYLPVFLNGDKLPTSGYRPRTVQSGDRLEVILIASGG